MKAFLASNKSHLLLTMFISLFLTFCSSPVESEMAESTEADLSKQLESIDLEELSPEEMDGLIFMREEEKLARDVYTILFEKYEMRIFENIAKSEQRHTSAIKMLLDRYELEDPVENDEVGIFINEDLQNLFNELITSASDSVAALKIGAAIEEIDIIDLVKQIDEVVDNKDILLVYNNLYRGSRNHLRGFVKNLSYLGETYTPLYMTSEAYEDIITTEMERGGKGKRKGNGKGQGRGHKGKN